MKYRIIKHGMHKVYYTAEFLDGNNWRALKTQIILSGEFPFNSDTHFRSARKALKAILKFLKGRQRESEDRQAEKIVFEGEL